MILTATVVFPFGAGSSYVPPSGWVFHSGTSEIVMSKT